ncbi:MAG TPA: alpha-amylase/4-alpha-glucanotransferase domain-containing protein [Chitinispirillaceae bacterium]|nr:alpha-amylase/4-alpha-glucanotransferase domain-containing protein [Chitinispirillaceae bacterium]
MNQYPHLRLSCGLPAYILEQANALNLSKVRDLFKRDAVELILTGYTEPFLSLSPTILTKENIQHGLRVFNELTGVVPTGYLPPFSNWEPSIIEMLREIGLTYAVLSQELFPSTIINSGGYWTAEHAGKSISIFPSISIHQTNAPADLIDWLEKINKSGLAAENDRLLTIHYLFSLDPLREAGPYRWLRFMASELDKHLLNYQPVRLCDAISSSQSRGFQYIPSSMVTEAHGQADRHFLNYLYSCDQAGILQRKLVDVHDKLATHTNLKTVPALRKQLFFVQDINRLFPGRESGFTLIGDRMWSFGKMIDIESSLDSIQEPEGGKIQVTDYFRDGGKTVILSNKHIKVYIDHKKGGQIFSFDHRDRSLNLASAYTPELHDPPDIVSSGRSRTWFLDRILPSNTGGNEFAQGGILSLSNFYQNPFDYKVSSAAGGVKAIMIRNCSYNIEERNIPLRVEKVFGLEKNSSIFSFVYQLTNPSLVPVNFKFTTELNFSFPSCGTPDLRVLHGSTVHENPGWNLYQLENVTRWTIDDRSGGIRIHFQTQKPVDVWFLPPGPVTRHSSPTHGLTMIIATEINLSPSANWKNVGKLTCRKLRKPGNHNDVC